MRVEIDYCGPDPEFDGAESLAVYLDDGTEVGRYCIVDDPEAERDLLEEMLLAVRQEGIAAGRQSILDARNRHG